MHGVVIRVTTSKNEVYETGAPWPVPAATAAKRQAALDGLHKLQQLKNTPGAIPDDFYTAIRDALLESAREPENLRCTVGLMLPQYDEEGDLASIRIWGIPGEGSPMVAKADQRASIVEEIDIGDTERITYMNAENVLDLDRQKAMAEFQESVAEEVAEMSGDVAEAPAAAEPKTTNGAPAASA